MEKTEENIADPEKRRQEAEIVLEAKVYGYNHSLIQL